ncbi:hypothetical protein B0H15DRAFT_798983 [Mycena belliarum]|uniref:Uncharacterized protein n=1 Tax=Mycena belliarum TaxID=1033014 RepID=A0AAD6UAD1_9AGAR|nr:hypothetical protein B0H15DRAFT_798983 [Mycena belliae]
MLPQPISPTAKINQDKSFTVPGLHPSTYKVYGVIPARVYHAAFGSKQSEWIYTGLSGSLVLGKDRGVVDGQGYWFRLLDDTGKTIWIFKMPATGFDYHVDKPFFHIFRGCAGRCRAHPFVCKPEDYGDPSHYPKQASILYDGSFIANHNFIPNEKFLRTCRARWGKEDDSYP